MINTKDMFYGQQEGEKILYTVKPHLLSPISKLFKLYIFCLALFIVLIAMVSISALNAGLFTIGLIFIAGVTFFGSLIVQSFDKRSISYITDRRLVRFEPTTFFATNIRSLSWDEAVKVKTYSPNILWKQMMVGTVVVHARTTVKTSDENISHTSADDIEINDVYLYRDLGNYIDKILFTYKQLPREVAQIHPFVPKPKGQRY